MIMARIHVYRDQPFLPRIGDEYQAVIPQLIRDPDDPFGDPTILPRIGDEYQAQIPQLIHDLGDPFGDPTIMPRVGDEYHAEVPQLSELRASTDGGADADHDLHFLVGLPLPLTSSTARLDLNRSESGRWLIPGLDEESWSGVEQDCFLLGLYVFEKDFVQVRRVVETKEMGAILLYYYGKFHSSSEYHRWHGCRKMRRFGRRMFSGPRQQELVSRMLPRLLAENREALLDVSALFGDWKMSLVDYVVALKTIVGIDILIEVVGLVKGRQEDLLDCSSFSPSEIIGLIRGGRRLSKERWSDLFWSAVWPRLRSRGWRSERQGNQGCGSKGNVVFLAPNIKKFYPKKLLKGVEYFNSVTEVLSRVGEDPRIIGFDCEPIEASSSSNECVSTLPLFDLNMPFSDSDAVDLTAEQDVAEDRHRTSIQVDVNQRRHSTRTRPPTASLIYQATYGYDTVRRSYKRKEADDQSRPSQRVRGSVSARLAESGASNEEGDSKK